LLKKGRESGSSIPVHVRSNGREAPDVTYLSCGIRVKEEKPEASPSDFSGDFR